MLSRCLLVVGLCLLGALAAAPELHGFYHTWIPTDSSLSVVTEQIRTLKAHGLMSKLTRLHVSLFGEHRHATLTLLEEALGRRGVLARPNGRAALHAATDNHTVGDGGLSFDVQALAFKGVEFDTLDELWAHCVANPSHWVFYTHSKGALHPSAHNDEQRIGQDRVVIGELHHGCLDMLSKGANVCGPRVSARPHLHYSGNAWWATCDYVSQLSRPSQEPAIKECIVRELANLNGTTGARLVFATGELEMPGSMCMPPFAVGTGRFHGEHWITSSPLVKPANCYDWPAHAYNLAFGYTTAPMNCRMAPIESWRTWPGSAFDFAYVSRAAYDWEHHMLRMARTGLRHVPAAKAVVGFYSGTLRTKAALDVFRGQLEKMRTGHGVAGVASSIRYRVRGALASNARALVAADPKWRAIKRNALVELWSHCTANLDDAVFYFNDYADAAVREASDTTVLGTTVCQRMLEHGANVCGAAVRSRPHIHVPGNAFWASCRYIALLPSPKTEIPTLPCTMADGQSGSTLEFPSASMSPDLNGCAPDWCLGVGRYRQAHWLATHPAAVLSRCNPPNCSFVDPEEMRPANTLPPATRSLYDFCFAMRSAYDNERYVLQQTLGI